MKPTKTLFMKKLLLIVLFVTPLLSLTTYAQRFEKLGDRKVNFKSDKEEISGIGDGFFNALRLKVSGGSINMQKMVVHFRNGQTHEVELKQNFADGDESRVIDIP